MEPLPGVEGSHWRDRVCHSHRVGCLYCEHEPTWRPLNPDHQDDWSVFGECRASREEVVRHLGDSAATERRTYLEPGRCCTGIFSRKSDEECARVRAMLAAELDELRKRREPAAPTPPAPAVKVEEAKPARRVVTIKQLGFFG